MKRKNKQDKFSSGILLFKKISLYLDRIRDLQNNDFVCIIRYYAQLRILYDTVRPLFIKNKEVILLDKKFIKLNPLINKQRKECLTIIKELDIMNDELYDLMQSRQLILKPKIRKSRRIRIKR